MSVRERLDLVECVLIPSHHCVISPKGGKLIKEKNAQNEKDPIFFIVVRNRPFLNEYCCLSVQNKAPITELKSVIKPVQIAKQKRTVKKGRPLNPHCSLCPYNFDRQASFNKRASVNEGTVCIGLRSTKFTESTGGDDQGR